MQTHCKFKLKDVVCISEERNRTIRYTVESCKDNTAKIFPTPARTSCIYTLKRISNGTLVEVQEDFIEMVS